jgi:hypothetical protein
MTGPPVLSQLHGLIRMITLNDYKYIIDNTEGKPAYIYFNAVARIMTSYMYAMLVDQYGDIPYTQALQGKGNISPKYDKGRRYL